MEKEIVMQLMGEKGATKRYMLSQKWLQKWDGIMDGQHNIVESNIKNLAMSLMNEQQEIIQKFID